MDKAGIIKEAYKRAGIRSDAAISKETGLNYDKLHRVRMKNPGSFRLSEFWLLQRHADFTEEEILQIASDSKIVCDIAQKGEKEVLEIKEIKEELDKRAAQGEARIYLIAYLVGRYTGRDAVPMELIRYALECSTEIHIITGGKHEAAVV